MRRATSIIAISQLINYAVPLLTFPLLVKTFDAKLYGVWIESNTLIALLSTLAGAGLGNATAALILNQAESESNRIYSNALYLFGAIGTMFAALLFLLAAPLNRLMVHHTSGDDVIRWTSPMVLVLALNWLASQVFRVRQRPFTFAVFDISLNIARVSVVVASVFHGDLTIFAITYTISQSVITLIEMVMAYRGIDLQVFSVVTSRQLLRFAVNLSVVNQSNWFVMYGDRLLLSFFTPSTAVAIYSASYQMTLVLVALGSPFLYPLLPIIGERWKADDMMGIQTAIYGTTRLMFIILIPAVVGLGMIGNNLLQILATESFARGGLLIGIIGCGVALDVLGTSLQYIFQVQGRPQVLRKIYIRAAVFNLLINLGAIPLFGYYGAGVTTLLTFILIAILLVMETHIPPPQLFDFHVISRCGIASLLMAGWLWLVVGSTIPHLIVAVGGGVVIYGLAIIQMGVIHIKELIQLFGNPLKRLLRMA